MCGFNVNTEVKSFEEFIGKLNMAIIDRKKNGDINIGTVIQRLYKFPCGEEYSVEIKRIE